MLQSTSIYAVFSFEKITTLLKKTPTSTQVKQYKYNASQIQTIKLKNISGNIKIRTHRSQQTIFINATKQTTNAIYNATYTQKQTSEPFTVNSYIKDNTLFIQPILPITDSKETIDYHLIVPANTTLFLETNKGSIHTKDTDGMITLTTKHGNIMCTNTHNSLIATIHQKGSINIELASKPIHATTNKGSICIYDAKDSIYALTQAGKIKVHSLSLPENGYLDLKADNGSIYLYLSQETEAFLHAITLQGTITSELPVTIDARTTLLNEDVWHKIKQEVKGSFAQQNSLYPNNQENKQKKQDPSSSKSIAIANPISKSITLKNNKGDIKIIDSAHF